MGCDGEYIGGVKVGDESVRADIRGGECATGVCEPETTPELSSPSSCFTASFYLPHISFFLSFSLSVSVSPSLSLPVSCALFQG